MAKTVKDKHGTILRVSKDEAARIVADGGKYLDKNTWKRHRAKLEVSTNAHTQAAR